MPESNDNLEQALLDAHRAPQLAAKIPASVPGLEGAYAIQRRIAAVSNLPVMVWKLGLTGLASRGAFGASEPIVGRLPASAIFCDRSSIAFLGSEMYVEAELVFEFGRDLPAQETPYTRQDICAALKGIYAGIEVVRTRFQSSDLPLGLLVADNAMAHGLVLGKKLSTGWQDRLADLPVSLSRNEEPAVRGSTAQAMGNPIDAVVWLANWMREHEERGLSREQLVASGTCTGVTEVFPGDKIIVGFDDVEGARVTFNPSN
ncbi:MAG: fumarylacetoacetate hydrolase family protein [Sphingorhabdus sp.]